jgi:hypothetical protein
MLRTHSPDDSDPDLQREVLLAVRAERRLREHELTRRRVLLALTVLLVIAGVTLAFLDHPFIGSVFAGGGCASGVAAIPRSGEAG